MEAILISRNPGNNNSEPTTIDFKLELNLADSQRPPGPVTDVPASEWAGSKSASYEENQLPIDLTLKSHSLSGFSAFGSDQPNEFATWTMGRETFLSSQSLREKCEDDMRSFAERSDHTEGFMISTSVSDGFGGFSSVFLEMLRDEFTKSTIFTTATIHDTLFWKREDSERSKNQRLLNTALSIHHLEELSSMILPIQPATSWEENESWARYLREDLSKPDSYSQILNMHLQSANSELREIDGLTSIVNQLNWRGDNKIATLSGACPILPPEQFDGLPGIQKLKDSFKDFSVQPLKPRKNLLPRSLDPRLTNPFAQYTIMRGYEGEELERLGVILEQSTLLKEPLSVWVCLSQPYPILPTHPPIFRSLIPSGRPLIIEFAPPTNPFTTPAGLFNVPPPIFPITSTYYTQPTSIPLLTTLSTSPTARNLLNYLAKGVAELQRVRWRGLYEFEEGEFGLGREGLIECRERLESLGDSLLGASGGYEDEDSDEGASGMVGDEEVGNDDEGEESDGFGL